MNPLVEVAKDVMEAAANLYADPDAVEKAIVVLGIAAVSTGVMYLGGKLIEKVYSNFSIFKHMS